MIYLGNERYILGPSHVRLRVFYDFFVCRTDVQRTVSEWFAEICMRMYTRGGS